VTCGRLKSESFSASVALPTGAVREDDTLRIIAGARQYSARDKRMVLHALPTGYHLDDHNGIRDPLGMCGERLGIDIHAVTADEVAIRNLSLCVERAHLAVSSLVAAPYASALAVITPDGAKLGVACIDFGAGTTTLSVFSDGHFIHTDAIAIGGAGITTDIARTLAAPLEHAERLKTLHGSAFATASDEREIITFPSVGESHRGMMNQITKAQLVVIIRPRSLNGLPEGGTGPDFASAVGLLKQWARGDDKLSGRAEQRYLGTGTGYFARVSEWIRDNF
jgi:cell division protein FtsA